MPRPRSRLGIATWVLQCSALAMLGVQVAVVQAINAGSEQWLGLGMLLSMPTLVVIVGAPLVGLVLLTIALWRGPRDKHVAIGAVLTAVNIAIIVSGALDWIV